MSSKFYNNTPAPAFAPLQSPDIDTNPRFTPNPNANKQPEHQDGNYRKLYTKDSTGQQIVVEFGK